MNRWQEIWQNKALDLVYSDVDDKKNILEELIKVDGFDSGFSPYSLESWILMVQDLSLKVNQKKCSSILEIGCGAGALLYELKNYINAECYGIDYSDSLIKIIQRLFNDSQSFISSEANNVPFANDKFDCIISHGVFFYFPSYGYVLEVLSEIYRTLKKGGQVFLMDINDANLKNDYLIDRIEIIGSKEEYDKRYPAELDHLFIDKNIFVDDIKKIGFKEIDFFKHAAPNYSGSKYRFNIKFEK